MFLREHGITTLSIPTCWRWLHHLGFTYDVQRKGYYVDGHERSDVVAACEQFCKVYLTELEPRCLRWVQFSEDELEAYTKLRPEVAYQYFDDAGTLNFEFHVDYCRSKGIQVDGDNATVVPKMSVRAPAESKPIAIFGQDESVFSQFLFLPKSWVGPNKERGLFPKSNGEGYMISAFVSRDSGFGLPVTEEQLQLVNAYRHGKQYFDKAAALEILKTVEKPPLTESPFVRGLLIGASKGGYWNSFHMALQFEDTVDCLKVLNPDIDLVFLFDHSQGHARKKEGALDANDMSRSFGGVQSKMRSSTIVDGCLGPYDRILNVGDCQSMVFEPDDVGPWWFSTDEIRESRRHDIIDNDNFKMVNRTRAQLALALKDAGIDVDSARPVNELKVFAVQHGIALQQRKVHTVEGWQGKSKGLLQILWERGWIDPSKCSKLDKSGKSFNTSFYSLKGKTDHTGRMDEPSSLRYLMGSCTDFQEEETALQHLGSQLGSKVIFTPKFHCEFAGEGIEYNWAHAKAKMRATPLREKKGRANFIKLVKKCICPETVLTKERVSKFAARARAYICTYYLLSHREEEDPNAADERHVPSIHISHKQQLLYKEIERLMKQFKTHRCALDFDQGFVKAELREERMAS
ncbi:hypothetical protein MHU86_22728 [Fragilaria crotonensis]|nr:hypothetical protein MHU86_22728 [Fragilaria crotonensis]